MSLSTGRAKDGEAQAKDGLKRCSGCKEPLPLAKFSKNRVTADGLQNACDDCRHNYYNDWFLRSHKNPDWRRKLNDNQIQVSLRRQLCTYGLSIQQYEELAAKGCAICGGKPTGRGRFAFDHDHETGTFRGLLCHFCNTGLGSFKDNPQLLVKAADYLGHAHISFIDTWESQHLLAA